MPNSGKHRLDKLLFERGLAPSRERAQALILAGRVLVNEQKIDKPGHAVDEGAAVRLLGDDLRYVSRGGLKLEAALRHWSIDLSGKFCLDVGASTGGFTDCMLQHGAARVLAVDTGYGQIADGLRRDARVTLMERTNARKLAPGDLPTGIEFFAMDVSFISATLVLPAVVTSIGEWWVNLKMSIPQGLKPSSFFGCGGTAEAVPCYRAIQTDPLPIGAKSRLEAVVLVKPQFEAGRENVGKGGIVRDPMAHQAAIERVRACVTELGGENIEVIDSPILGAEGNREFLMHCWLRSGQLRSGQRSAISDQRSADGG